MKISILIPCHNEEKSIRRCVESCLNQTRIPDEIVVVDDGSSDNSPEILRGFGNKIKVVTLDKATGNKSYAQQIGLNEVTGDVFVATDGDTRLDRNFVERVEKNFSDPKVMAMSGYVRSLKYNWITACRAFDYVIGQNLHKQAQSYLNYMMVIPGASGAFRTKEFRENVSFDHDTITEDLDFTYKYHRKNLAIFYDRKAVVYTQDPRTLNAYVNQMRRWFGGGWQNLKKHFSGDILQNPGMTLELSLVYIEGIIYSFLLYLLPILNVLLFLKIFGVLLLMILLQVIYASIKEKRADILTVTFTYPFLMYVNSYIFIEQFVLEVLFNRKKLVWFQPERIEL